jgi:hypothetical protein
MQIMQVQVGNVLYPLTEGQPLPISVGETIKVFYAFKYKIPEQSSVRVWASLYRYTAGILNRSGDAQTKSTITLAKSTEWTPYQGQIDITVGSINAGLWGLIVELPDYGGMEAKIDDCIEVAAAPNIIEQILPILIMVMMMGMIMPMMGEEA